MRTVSQLSKLTGMNRRTVQYYANEKVPGKSGEGAGIIAPCHVSENGYRYFDDDALFELLAIKTLKQCGYEPEAIRQLLESEGFDLADSADMQLKAIERAKRELELQEQFVNIVKLLGTADYDNDDEMAVVVMSLVTKMLLISMEQVIREYDPDFVLDLDKEELKNAMGQQRGEQAARMAEAYIKVMGHAEKGEMDSAVETLPEEIKATIREESDGLDDSISNAVNTLTELFESGASPRSKKAQQCAALMFQESFPRRRLAELEAVTEFVAKLMEGTYVSILAELIFGEGFSDFVTKSFDSYYATARKSVEKKRARLEAAEDKSEKGPSQAATA